VQGFDPTVLIVLGGLLLAGFAAHAAGALTHVPRVTLLLLLGLAAGPHALDLVPAGIADWFPLAAHMALAMVGFLLGERFYGKDLARSGRVVLWVSLLEVLGAAALVTAATLVAGGSLPLALALGGIAGASAPAAILDLVQESRAAGRLTDTVLEVVAIDDAWGIILFSLCLVSAEGLLGQGSVVSELGAALWEVGGALVLGVLLGLPMAWLTGRVRDGEPTLLEAAGFVFLCGGLAMRLDVSYLLACMALGATVANRARHHTRPFRDIEGVSEPFLVVFFLLAGYALELDALGSLGLVTLAYVVARSAGKVLGAGAGAAVARAAPAVRRRIGWCLLPQAGVALGMALLVAERIPVLAGTVVTVVIASTVVFELAGPVVTRRQLARAGELGTAPRRRRWVSRRRPGSGRRPSRRS
jgi:Kef-type K+ transport system membrane component KefB